MCGILLHSLANFVRCQSRDVNGHSICYLNGARRRATDSFLLVEGTFCQLTFHVVLIFHVVPLGKLHLAEAVKLFDASTLTHLKQEFGGLQTLLRNHHQIFQGTTGEHLLAKPTYMHHWFPRYHGRAFASKADLYTSLVSKVPRESVC